VAVSKVGHGKTPQKAVTSPYGQIQRGDRGTYRLFVKLQFHFHSRKICMHKYILYCTIIYLQTNSNVLARKIGNSKINIKKLSIIRKWNNLEIWQLTIQGPWVYAFGFRLNIFF
jgi:hypothetical protein